MAEDIIWYILGACLVFGVSALISIRHHGRVADVQQIY